MTGANFRSFALAGLLAAGSLLVDATGASATPVAGGLASSGFSDIAREASIVTEVGRRGRRVSRNWQASRHRDHRYRYRRGPYVGFRTPYYYGGLHPYFGGYPRYGYYPFDYNEFDHDDDYYQPPVRQSYRGNRSCRRAHSACVRNWGYGGANYKGCMRYERCRAR